MDYGKMSLDEHKKYQGKVEMKSKVPLENRQDLSVYYTPGVAEPCMQIYQDPAKAYDYTWKGNSVAVISDGSAVLGLGNIGWLAGLPVMEGKSILFKEFANIDTVPIVLSTQDPEEVIRVVEAIAPSFGGINLEDISAPNCFVIEEELKRRLDIPVFHDDQHGTAVVALAWLINALRLVDKKPENIKVVMTWAWAAGIAIAKILNSYWVQRIIMVDSKWAIYKGRDNLNKYKEQVANLNIDNEKWSLQEVLKWADVFMWVSQPNLLTSKDIANMSDKAIVFAMANPIPEIMPEDAKKWWAYIVATGRSDFPNQVNNVLAFPGIFRWALDARIANIEDKHNIAAAKALADYVQDLWPDNILPNPLDKWVAQAVAKAVQQA